MRDSTRREGQNRLRFYSVFQESPHEQSCHHAVLLSYMCGDPEAGFILSLAVAVGVAVGSIRYSWWDADMVMAAIASYTLGSHGDLRQHMHLR